MKKQNLTTKQLIALNLMLQGINEPEIAEQLHISQSAVSQMYHRIKLKIPGLRYANYIKGRAWKLKHNY